MTLTADVEGVGWVSRGDPPSWWVALASSAPTLRNRTASGVQGEDANRRGPLTDEFRPHPGTRSPPGAGRRAPQDQAPARPHRPAPVLRGDDALRRQGPHRAQVFPVQDRGVFSPPAVRRQEHPPGCEEVVRAQVPAPDDLDRRPDPVHRPASRGRHRADRQPRPGQGPDPPPPQEPLEEGLAVLRQHPLHQDPRHRPRAVADLDVPLLPLDLHPLLHHLQRRHDARRANVGDQPVVGLPREASRVPELLQLAHDLRLLV